MFDVCCAFVNVSAFSLGAKLKKVAAKAAAKATAKTMSDDLSTSHVCHC